MRNLFFVFLFFGPAATPAQAQTWGPAGAGVDNDAYCFTLWNNTLVAGGDFGFPCDGVSAWNTSSWGCAGGGISESVRALTVYNTELIAGGVFWINPPAPDCYGIARWNGSLWQSLGTGFDNDVLALTVWNNQLVAAGDFTLADGQPCSRIALWSGTGWLPMNTGLNNDVRALAVYNGELYAGGDFTNAGGNTAADRLAKWDGANWIPVPGTPGGMDSTVRVLFVSGSTLYMGGDFIEVAGNTNCARIASFNGSSWQAYANGTDGPVRAIGFTGADLVIGGDFMNAGGNPASRVARWTGAAWTNMGAGMNGPVRALETFNNELYATGDFTIADTNNVNYVARWFIPPPVPVAAFTANDTTLCSGDCVSFTDLSQNSPTGWTWSFPGGTPSFSTQQNPVVCYNTPGIYNVSLTAVNSSGNSSVSHLSYIDVQICAGITDAAGEQGAIRVYPNPLQETARIEIPAGMTNPQAAVYDLAGRLLLEPEQCACGFILHGETLVPGLYVLVITGDTNRSFRQKISVK